MKIMVVDDSLTMRKMIISKLKSAVSFTKVLEAEDGLDALRVLKKAGSVDVILLDWVMPKMDGLEFLKTIRSKKHYKNIPVVMITSEAGEGQRELAVQAGVTAYLVKPPNDETFRKILSGKISLAVNGEAGIEDLSEESKIADESKGMEDMLRESVKFILETVTGLHVKHIRTSIKDNHFCERGFSGITDFHGKKEGTTAICMPEALLKRISGKLTELREDEITQEVLCDTIMELINQITGTVKTKIGKSSEVISFSMPRAIVGQETDFTDYTAFSCTMMLFTLDGQEFSVLLSTESGRGAAEEKIVESTQASQAFSGEEEALVVDDDMQEIVDGFVIESEESLEQLDQDLVDLDKSKEDMELVSNVFRAFHTLKGNSRALDFNMMEKMVHRTEDVIRKVRDGEMMVTSEMMDVVFEAVDLIKLLLQDIKDRKKRPRDLDPMISKLKQVLEGKVEKEPEEDLVIEEDMQEIVDGFIIESEEYLEQLDQDLVELDNSKENMELVGNVFRAFHTLKGNSRALGFEQMERMVHRTEDVIRKVRDGEMKVNSGMMDVILESVDLIKTLLQDVKDRKKRPRDLDSVVDKLKQILEGKKEDDTEEKLNIDEDMKEIVDGFILESEELLSQMDQDLVSLEETPEGEELINTVFRGLHTLKGNSRALGFDKLEELDHKTEDVIRKVRDGKINIRPELMDVVLRSVDIIKLLLADIKKGVVSKIDFSDIKAELALVLEEKYDELKTKQEKVKEAAPPKAEQKKPAATTIRVDIGKLDKLIDVTGELVLNKNRLLNFSQQLEHGLQVDNVEEFLNEVNAQMGFLVSDLQSGVMSTRMQPIGKVFSKYPRVVRDLAREAGKEIDLIITGQETELDNTIVEEIGDPLIHMVRNSCDHGVETPDVRKAQGKDSKGRIELMAYYEGNFVVIEIRDDGKGIDQQIIRKKGIDKGLITEEQAKTMAKGDILNLVFMPGFSTAEKVTAVSGRGVGMDVVKTSIAKLNGIIEMDSELGKGTTVKIKLPLTLAVMVGLEVEVGEEKYLIPQESIVEIITVPKKAFQIAKKEKKFLFRNKHTLPLVDLKETLKQKMNGKSDTEKGYIVIIGEVEKRTGVLVDNIIQQQEVVIKPLGKYVNNYRLKEINGATIMGDGSIELIINPNRLMAIGQEIGS